MDIQFNYTSYYRPTPAWTRFNNNLNYQKWIEF